jgi:hypothetical protein
VPIVSNVKLAEGTFSLEDVHLIDGYDPTYYAALRDPLIARWDAEIGVTR